MFGIIGSIISAVSGAVSAIGSGIANLASGIASLAVSVWQGVSSFIGSLVKAFMPEAEVPEEEYDSFGYALTKLELDNYDSVAEYIRAGKEKMNNFTLEEKEEIKNFSEEEKKGYASIALSAYTKGISEKFGLEDSINIGTLEGAQKLKLQPEEFKELVDEYNEGNLPTLNINAFLENKLDNKDDSKMYEYLKDKLDRLNEDFDIEDAAEIQ